ncbi:MAG: glycosyltransferase involved in cell wall biosynthesis, partial [Pirellulaceae bacterium]
MDSSEMKIAYITSGAAGMFCGSCMHDNTLARALARKNVDIQLIPTYTPIRTDEEDVSMDRVFFGGINVFLQQKIPLFRYLPALFDRWFDNPRLLKWVSSRAMETSAKELGALTVSMLKGRSGYQKKEIRQLVHWLQSTVKPDLVVFSNMLVAGCIPAIKEALNIPVLVTLQGDDIFLDDLPEPYRSQSLNEIRRLVSDVDGFVVNSDYYGQHMSECFEIPSEKLNVLPLGIDTHGFPAEFPSRERGAVKTVGYLARLAPEKGLHVLVDAFLHLRKTDDKTQLRIAGWLGPQNENYAEQQFAKLRDAGLESAFEYVGSIDRHEKIDFLS